MKCHCPTRLLRCRSTERARPFYLSGCCRTSITSMESTVFYETVASCATNSFACCFAFAGLSFECGPSRTLGGGSLTLDW
jgi:hypothetical protein